MEQCADCGKTFFLKKKFYSYPGIRKGSYEITKDVIECEKCLYKRQRDDLGEVGEGANLFTKVWVQMHKEKWKKALEILNEYFDKKDATNWYTKGNILLNLKKYTGALKCYDEALFLDTHYVKAWYRKGGLLLQKKNYEGAVKCFENVVKLEGKVTGEYPNQNWYLAGMLNILYAALLNNNALVKKKKPAKEAEKKFLNALNALYFLFTSGFVVGKNKKGNEVVYTPIKCGTVSLQEPNDMEDINKFIDICVEKRNEILDIIEPKVSIEIAELGYKH